MPGKAHVARDLPLDPDAEEVVRLLSKGANGSRREVFLARVREVEALALSLVRPAAVYGWWENASLPAGLAPESAAWTALGLVTVGEAICATSRELAAAKDLARATILDAWASQLVESLAERLDGTLRDQMGQVPGGPRVSPGYGSWTLDRQALLFAQLPAAEIGVTLSERFLMSPVKSISFAIPFGARWAGQGRPLKGDKCRACELKTCDMRRC